jgi:predicted Rossmann fold nucleotide-binding protein DprA/Smf involved in DNA uptake
MEELDPAFCFTEKINSSTPEQLLPDDIVSDDEKKLLNFIDIYPQSIDEIIQQCGMSPQKVNELLLTLELKGVVEALAGKQFQRVTTVDNT